jgi:hypothetical protein
MSSITLEALERRTDPTDPVVAAFVGQAIDANGGPLNDEQLRNVLLALSESR